MTALEKALEKYMNNDPEGWDRFLHGAKCIVLDPIECGVKYTTLQDQTSAAGYKTRKWGHGKIQIWRG